MSEAVCVLVVTYFECVFCQSNVGLFLVVVVSCHCRLVYYTFGLALSIWRACFALSAVAVFLCYGFGVLCVYQCLVVVCYYLFHVWHTAIAEFYCVSIQESV